MKLKLRIGGSSLQRVAAGSAAAGAVVLAITGALVFRSTGRPAAAAVRRLVLSDRVTLGFVRLALVVLALYAVSSVAALAVGGRWMKALSHSGFDGDEPLATNERLERVKADLRLALEERDRAFLLLQEYLHG